MKDNITIIPPALAATEGDTVEFVCVSNSQVTWKFQNSNLPPHVVTGYIEELDAYRMTISFVRRDNAGTYTCSSTQDNILYETEGELTVIGRLKKI